ncbi:MAG: DUF1572 domain-containing protein [Cytophagaceae bacterium]|nr:DUF1572 domain-containing protein [Cytophagaceae bacterium]
MQDNYLTSVIKQFEYYKSLGDQTLKRIPEACLCNQYNEASNSIAVVVQHLSGNMKSRWTDFLNSDGEKDWRNRDAEFETLVSTEKEVWDLWEEGWDCLFRALRSLKASDLSTIVYIRHQGHTVMEAINRQLAHYPYHIGQIVMLGKMYAEEWKSLSIPKGSSSDYNAEKFSHEKHRGHFTDEYLSKNKKQG